MGGNITLSDIFKSSFLSKAVESFSVVDLLVCMAVSLLLGLLIYMVYKKAYVGVMYSRSFNISLVALVMITSLVITTVTSNVVLSLGMVGALSIVRFRTAIKDPMDIVYLFWAIAAGIVVGAGMLLIALVGSLIIAIVIYVLSTRKAKGQPYLLIVNMISGEPEARVLEIVQGATGRYNVKSKSMRLGGACELVLEVNIKDNETQIIDNLSALDGIENAVMMAYNGEYSL